MKIYKVIVIPDTQIPDHDPRALSVVEKFMADERWDEWIQIGDFMDFDQISRFNKDAPGRIEGRRLKEDFRVANQILDRHQAIVRSRNKNAKFTLLTGNHDYRAQVFEEDHPQLKGMLGLDVNLRLEERGIKLVSCYPHGDKYTIGKASFVHGIYTGQTAARKMADNFGCDVHFGHLHEVATASKARWGNDNAVIGQSLGCLCKMDLEYIGKNPKNWQHAFGIYYFLPNGDYTYYVPIIKNYQFVAPSGKLYRA